MSEPPPDGPTDANVPGTATAAAVPSGAHRHPGGRPRLPDTDRAILRAVGELMAEEGVRGTTINAVAARSGVARGTVYRRFPNRSAMIAAAVRASGAWPELSLGDDLEANVRRQAEESRAVLARPEFQAMMPALLEMGLNGEADETVRSTVFPRRRQMGAMYERLAGEAGFRTDVAPTLPNDLLIGAMIYRLLHDGAAPSSDEAQAIVDVILDGVRRREVGR
jgi:AcrR family transcriptional regulator